jgi:tRNA(fMet)-specific endonuclease VapC
MGTAIREPEQVHGPVHEGWQATATDTEKTKRFLMKVMLDSNICIYIIKQKPQSVLQRFQAFQVGDIGISAITLAELQYGAMKSDRPRRNRESLKEFVSVLDVAPFDAAATEAYGEIRAALEKAGRPIGAMDFLIAAHALSLGTRLETNNEREFKRVRGLRLENWI